MGCCFGAYFETDENPNELEQNERDPIVIAIDEEKAIISADPWKYAMNLTIQETQTLLENATYDTTKIFIPPIKYAKVVKVYDGDTVHIAAPLFDGVISRFRVRLNAIDCPELRTKNEFEKKAGIIARDLLHSKIDSEIIEIKDISYDKYGRVLGTIYLDNLNINDWMISTGFAVQYSGRGVKLVAKTDWKSKVQQFNANNADLRES